MPFHSIEARHLIGGELSYTCLGNDNYEISLEIFRDCNCINCALFDDPASLVVFDANGVTQQSLSIFSPQINLVPLNTDGLCLENVPDVCVERGLYQTITNLPPIPGGYQIVYQRCCRNETIVNLSNPDDQGNTYVIAIPETDSTNPCHNSSPKFNNFPPILVCANSPLIFDHSAFDADGDELVYSLCTPFQGASPNDPAPIVVPPPPYEPVVWRFPFSELNQLGGMPEMTIDETSGELRAFPDATGQYVVGICVSEYRNGVLLSQNIRDFQFNVAECDIVLADITVDTDVIGEAQTCFGESFQLEGTIFGGDTFVWSPFTGLDNPNILTPTILSVTEPTTYVLVATDFSTGCEDTDTITVYPVTALADAGTDMTTCSSGSVQLQGSGGESYLWQPSTGLSDPTSPNPTATPGETTTYTLTVTAGPNCQDSAEVTVFVVENSDPGTVSNELQIICDGDAIEVLHSGFGLNNGDVGGFILHTNPDAVLGGVIAANTDGTFSLADHPNIQPYTLYYLSPIAGPEGLMAGLPNFEDECTNLSPGTPVVFLSPISFLVDEFCDLNTGDYFVSVQLQGGYPEYDNSLTYTVSGDFQGTFGFNEVFTAVFIESSMDGYEFEVGDDCGTVLLNGDPFECTKNPVELLSFEGEVQSNGNFLQWTTASESNNEYFSIARSVDGLQYEVIEAVKSLGDSQNIQTYGFLDRNAPSGATYYQLSQTDLNGLTTYLGVVGLQRRERDLTIEELYPIPAKNHLNIRLHTPNSGMCQWKVVNIHGQKVFQSASSVSSGLQELTLDVSSWTEGVYILQLEVNGKRVTRKLVVRAME